MTQRDSEKLIEDFFIAAWASRVPLFMNNGPDVDQAAPYAMFIVLPGSGRTRVVGQGAKAEYAGIVQVTIFTKAGSGDKVGTQHAYDAGKILEYQDIGGVTFTALGIQKLGVLSDSEGLYQTVVRIPFSWDG
jgi:hypothetical protein